jgi:hypothetical protein
MLRFFRAESGEQKRLEEHPLLASTGTEELLQLIRCIDFDLFLSRLWPVASPEPDLGAGAAHRVQHHDGSPVRRLLIAALFAARREQDHDVRTIEP